MPNISVERGRTGEHLPGRSPDPASDVLLYRPPKRAVDCGFPGDDVGLYFYPGPGGTTRYYLCCSDGPLSSPSFWFLDSPIEAAAFILGSEDWDLARLNAPDRERIRSHFPEYFR